MPIRASAARLGIRQLLNKFLDMSLERIARRTIVNACRWNIVPLLGSPELAGSVVFVIFDEGLTGVGGGGRVAALAVGPAVRAHSRFGGATSHYGLLRTIEDAWRLPRLGLSAKAAPITGIWK